MNATPRSTFQQHRIHHYGSSINSLEYFNLLTSDELLNEVEALLPDHRERLFPPTETLSLFLAQVMSADQSCQQIVNQAAIQRLPQEPVSHVTQFLGAQISDLTPDAWRWRQRRVLLADGTTATMPDTEANQHQFPQQGRQLPGLGFPICRIVGITCLGSGALLNVAIGKFNGKGSGEQGLLRSIQNTFKPGDVLLGDAFYATYFFIAEMISRGVDLVMEQQGARRRSTDFRLGKRLRRLFTFASAIPVVAFLFPRSVTDRSINQS